MTTLKPPTEEMISPVMSHMMVKDEGSQTRLPKISIQEISRLSSATRFEDEKHESIENFEPEEVVSKVTTLFSGEDVHSVRSSDEAEMAQQCLSSVEWIFDTSTTDVGAIDLAFPENLDPKFKEVECLPLSYFTLNAKERLLLAFAENFRRQFVVSPEYAGRRPLVLAPKNECGVQKFVCTTIKPTPFLIPKIIGSWEECASFVADFIIYEPLENPLQLVSYC
ncbi:unnamed protein product [Hermetia illucens]|uniref:Uncharacterized protein n=1 Tax=Hermetia illucens TaxID=343691 RepID=A0A7R8UNR5_HERIL|nr:unnamed protein product [Hermetia illucens]